MDELPLSEDFFQEMDVELPPLHVYQPQAIQVSLTDQDRESFPTDLSQSVYTFMGGTQQQEVSPTLFQERVVIDTNIVPIGTDLGSLLVYGDSRPLSVDDMNIEPLCFDIDMESFLNDTYQFENTLIAVANTSGPFAHLETPATFSDSNSGKARNVDEMRGKNTAVASSSGSDCGQSFGSVQSIFGKSLVQSGNLKHCIANHTAQNPFQCDMCPKQFRKLSDYQKHRRAHTGEKSFKCDICQKPFRTSRICHRHRRTHTGEKPFQCGICSKQFCTSSYCHRHRRTHTGEKPFKCNICQKLFRTSGNFQRHRRTHTGEKPFLCDICAKQFSTSNNYQRHRRIHTGEKPFRCNFCQKQFSDPTNYQIHRRIHTGE